MSYSHTTVVVMDVPLSGSGPRRCHDAAASPIDLNIDSETSKGTKTFSHPILSRDTFLQITFFLLRNYSWLQVTDYCL